MFSRCEQYLYELSALDWPGMLQPWCWLVVCTAVFLMGTAWMWMRWERA
jgi:hypothetical protein